MVDGQQNNKIFFIYIFFSSTQTNAIEFKGKFLQGHYIIGVTNPSFNATAIETSTEEY